MAVKRIGYLFLEPGRFTLSVACILAIAFLAPLKQAGLAGQNAAASAIVNPEQLEARNNNAFAQILGEVRAGAADFMFIKTERYLHSGIGYAPHLDAGAMARNGNIQIKEDDHDHAHHDEVPADPSTLEGLNTKMASQTLGEEGVEVGSRGIAPGQAAREEEAGEGHEVPTIIRTSEKDFRGFLGDLEREIKPWQDPKLPHFNASGSELLPWYRLMTLSNPRFVRGYRVGAMWLSFEGHSDEALEFLCEGISQNKNNPELFQLYLSEAMIRVRSSHKEDAARPSEALEAAKKGLELALSCRPEEGKTGAIKNGLLWTEDHEEDFTFLARLVPMLLESSGQFVPALEAAKRSSALAPDDAVLQRIKERLEKGESNYAVGPRQ